MRHCESSKNLFVGQPRRYCCSFIFFPMYFLSSWIFMTSLLRWINFVNRILRAIKKNCQKLFRMFVRIFEIERKPFLEFLEKASFAIIFSKNPLQSLLLLNCGKTKDITFCSGSRYNLQLERSWKWKGKEKIYVWFVSLCNRFSGSLRNSFLLASSHEIAGFPDVLLPRNIDPCFMLQFSSMSESISFRLIQWHHVTTKDNERRVNNVCCIISVSADSKRMFLSFARHDSSSQTLFLQPAKSESVSQTAFNFDWSWKLKHTTEMKKKCKQTWCKTRLALYFFPSFECEVIWSQFLREKVNLDAWLRKRNRFEAYCYRCRLT